VQQAREQGVHATKEMQLAAQRVASENAKLRDLLRKTGYTDKTIDAWVRENGCLNSSEHCQTALNLSSGTTTQTVAITYPPARNINVTEGKSTLIRTSSSGWCSPSPERSPHPMESSTRESEISRKRDCAGICTKSASLSENRDATRPPCQLLTLLAENPTADILQVQLPSQSRNTGNLEDCNSEGVECSAAYKMLIRYATSEEKMDKIAAALESGCTPSTGGGCRVKKGVVWKVLDEEC
jgi:hypothetical protein